MSFKPCCLMMRVSAGAANPTAHIADMFAALSDVFAPRRVSTRCDGDQQRFEQLDVGTYEGDRLWAGETIGDEPISRCSSGMPISGLSRGSCASYGLTAIGALRHFGVLDSEPAWYGRWHGDSVGMRELIRINFTWSSDERTLEISFPLSGYPLSATRLGADGIIADGDALLAQHNRALLLPVIGRARTSLGLAPTDASWRLEGDFGWHYPDDEADIRRWLPRISA